MLRKLTQSMIDTSAFPYLLRKNNGMAWRDRHGYQRVLLSEPS